MSFERSPPAIFGEKLERKLDETLDANERTFPGTLLPTELSSSLGLASLEHSQLTSTQLTCKDKSGIPKRTSTPHSLLHIQTTTTYTMRTTLPVLLALVAVVHAQQASSPSKG
jgi:hypothetical protein